MKKDTYYSPECEELELLVKEDCMLYTSNQDTEDMIISEEIFI